MNSEFDCIVVGAGLAGLVAAHFMQSAGLSTLIIEASDRPGGRVKSDLIDGFTLDHGFQVINPSYSNIKQLGVLDFLHFTPMVNGIVPFRPTDSGLNFVAAKRAFLRGVFLDEPKNVAPIVRREIYKSFISGKPGFVDGGASAFSQALANPISNIHYNEIVQKISAKEVVTSHARYSSPYVIVSTDPITANQLIPSMDIVSMNGSKTWYHVSNEQVDKADILRVQLRSKVINSFAISDRVRSYAPHGKQLFSSTTLEDSTESEVRRELSRIWNCDTSKWELIGSYEVKSSLPKHPQGKPLYSSNEVADGIFVAGDHRGYPSQQGAMESGKRAAKKIIERVLPTQL